MSKTIQNDLIEICSDLICNKILENIHQACYFSVLADEATDVANEEQLSISIRYVDEGSPKEVFWGFSVSGVTEQAITDAILSQLEKWQLQFVVKHRWSWSYGWEISACIIAKHPKA